MADEQSGERSEKATPKREQDARKKGQVARSRELSTAAILLASGLGFTWSGGRIGEKMFLIAHRSFSFSPGDFMDGNRLMGVLLDSILQALSGLLPLFGLIFVAAAVAPVAIGGLSFSVGAMGFKANRLSPAKGLKRMFGASAAMELFKSIGKFALVALVAWWILSHLFQQFLSLGEQGVGAAVVSGLHLVVLAFFGVSASLLIIAAIDIPFQLWNYSRQLKMTRQEMKDEFKDTEGRPEVRSRIRQQQREIAQHRMMTEIPTADVVITNPEHFAVALRYDDFGERAPVLVGKGADLIALKIREIAKANEVTVVEAPSLARSIFYTTELDQEIPRGLFLAVATVLAYVYRLKTYRSDGGEAPVFDTTFPIPEDLRH